ncbi:MAG: hypothetical protein M3N13_00285 [Candidatus Eremiobacteraeota bacterium]|nr:hypothetical protein [Candidatus Eremiobacteraeota bacterium]
MRKSERGAGWFLVLMGGLGLLFFVLVEPKVTIKDGATTFDATVLNAVTFILCLLTYSVYRQASRGVDAALEAVRETKRQTDLDERKRSTTHAPYLAVKVDQTVDDVPKRRVTTLRMTLVNVGLGPAIDVQVRAHPIVWSLVQLATPFTADLNVFAKMICENRPASELRLPDGRESFVSQAAVIMQGQSHQITLPIPIAFPYLSADPHPAEAPWAWDVPIPPLDEPRFLSAVKSDRWFSSQSFVPHSPMTLSTMREDKKEVERTVELIAVWKPDQLNPGYVISLSYTGIGLNDGELATQGLGRVEESYGVLLDAREDHEATVSLRNSLIPNMGLEIEMTSWHISEDVQESVPVEIRKIVGAVDPAVSLCGLDEARSLAQITLAKVKALGDSGIATKPNIDADLLKRVRPDPFQTLLAFGYSPYLLRALTIEELTDLDFSTRSASGF